MMTAPENPAERTTTDNYHFSEQVGHVLRKVYQRHMAIFQQNVGHSLTAVQFITLCAVRDKGPSSLTELVEATAVDQATIRGIIERLKARDLITVSSDPTDRRKVVIGLTEIGGVLVAQTVPDAEIVSELTFGSLNPAERIALVFLLKKMLDDPPMV